MLKSYSFNESESWKTIKKGLSESEAKGLKEKAAILLGRDVEYKDEDGKLFFYGSENERVKLMEANLAD